MAIGSAKKFDQHQWSTLKTKAIYNISESYKNKSQVQRYKEADRRR